MTRARAGRLAHRKSLGQHFLTNPEIVNRIATDVSVPGNGIVLEVGPGTGQLTEALLARGLTVLGLELDVALVEHLRRRFRGQPRFTAVEGDARTAEPRDLLPAGAANSLAVNLPYIADNPIVRHFLEADPQPFEMVVMVQKEVAAEMAAPPGDLSLLALAVQVYADAQVLFEVPPEAFDPPPKVRSSVVRLRPRVQPLVPREKLEAFFSLARNTFRNPRKQLHNALGRAAWLPPGAAHDILTSTEIDPTRRPETLTIDEWLRILDALEAARTNA